MTNISDVNSAIDSESAGGSHVKVKNKFPLVNSTKSSKIESVLKKKKFVNRRKRNNMKKRKSSSSPEIMTNGHLPSSEEKKHEENGRYPTRIRTKNIMPDMIPGHLHFSSSEDTDICDSDELHIDLNAEEITQNNHIKSKPNLERKPISSLKQKTLSKKVTSKKHIKAKQQDHSSESQDSAEDDYKECPICGTTLADKHSFTLHIREHNTNKQSRVCQICSKKLSSPSSLDRHMYVHSGERPFKCSLCHLSFTTNGNMHRHMRTHGTRLGQVKEPDESDEDKMDQFAVKQKRPNSVLSMREESTEDDATVKKVKLETPAQSFKCHVCSKVCTSLDLFRSHMKIHPDDPIKCHKCNVVCKSYSCYEVHSCSGSAPSETKERVVGFYDLNFVAFSSKNFPLIAKRECEDKCRRPSSALLAFECRTCGKAFPSKQTVLQHENVHESSSGTYCHTCECIFETEKQFHSHQLTHRSVEINKNCSDTKCLETKQDFLAMLGLRCVEVWNKSGQCVNSNENCCKIKKEEDVFTDVQDNSQTDNSNDFADIPSIISLTSKTQIPDMRSSPVAAEPASPQDFSVDRAPMSPVVEGSANASLNHSSGGLLAESKEASSETQNGESDQPLSCKKCSQVFSTEKELRYHARSHSQSGQPHKCSFCSYQSVDKSTLMRHMRTHNGERPFKCSICDYAFTTKANSHRHVKKKHKLPDYKVADAIVYNPNMLESNIVETFTSDMNSNETVCKYCNTDFKYNRVLRHHLRSMNNSCQKKPFSCRNCKLGFSTKNNCIRHINQQHPHLKDSLKDLIVVNTPQKMDQDHHSDSTSSSNLIDEPQGALVIDDTWEGECNKSEYQESEPPSETDKISSNEQLENQLNNMSEDDRVSIAQSLVSLSEGVHPQMAPLDLSVRALDLTAPLDFSNSNAKFSGLKSNEMGLDLTVYNSPKNSEVLAPQPAHSSPVITKIFEPEPLTNNALSPINLIQKDAAHMNNYQISPINPVIPMICLSQSCPTPPVINASLPSQIFVPNVICLPIPSESTSLPSQQVVKEKLSTAQKTCQCDYCDAQFTLKSNKERHIKKKHPEHARPTRSRNFISVLPSTDAQKQTISTLSDKTRHALRTVLNTKVNNVKLEAGAEEGESQLNISEGNMESFMENGHISESIDKHSEDAKSDSENIDLASVSSLINTANSQAIKHIMRDAKNCDMNPQLLQICDNAHSSSDTDSGSSSDSKKKSSYSKCKNHIKCGICPHTFPWHSSLKRHERTHTGDKPFKCFFCPVQFTTKSNRDRHVGRKHKSNESIRKSGQEGLYRCDTCPNSSFHTPEELKKHINSHHTLTEERAKQFVAHISSTENASNINFAQIKLLKANNNTVSDIADASFECRFCKTMYKTETDRVNHIKELHPSEYSALMGKVDGFPYARVLPWKKNGLVKDKDETVNGNACQDETFTCFFCLERLKTKDLLFEHINKHSADVPCVCKLCKLTFHTIKDLNIWEHQLEHMRESPLEKAAEKVLSLCNNNSGKTKPNSFLNAFMSRNETPKPAHANPAPAIVEHSAEATEVPGDGNLIVNLLGGEDPKVIDEMIDCAVRSRMESKA